MDDLHRETLLILARDSIAAAFAGAPPAQPDNMAEVFSEKRGAFVTLKQSGLLRGCIGRVESEWPLWETVARMARAAAFDDPRFPALEETDLDNVDVEISVLTPPRPISSPDEIEVGVHGLIVEMGYNKGLLLPQVAVEWKWDSGEFLEQTCLKAGLDASSWQDPDASIYVFSAEVFGEREG